MALWIARWIARAALVGVLGPVLSGCAGAPEDERVTWQCARTPDGRSWDCAQQRMRGGVAAGAVAPAPRAPARPRASDTASDVETAAGKEPPAAPATVPVADPASSREAWAERLPGLQESQPVAEASPVAVARLDTGGSRGAPPEPEPAMARWERAKTLPPAPATPQAPTAVAEGRLVVAPPPEVAAGLVAAEPAATIADTASSTTDKATTEKASTTAATATADAAAITVERAAAPGPPPLPVPAAGPAPGAAPSAPQAVAANRSAADSGEARPAAGTGRKPPAPSDARVPAAERAVGAGVSGRDEQHPSPRGPERRYTVQVGAFHTDREAHAYVAQHRLGEVPLELQRRNRGGREYSVLTFGSFATMREAAAAWQRVAAGRELDFWVRPADRGPE